jgi:glycosyltransferase involved in cell wall biosynthesis
MMKIEWCPKDIFIDKAKEVVLPTEVVLDIGCGIRPQDFFKPQMHILCEPYEEYVQVLKERFRYSSGYLILKSTANAMLAQLPDQSVDSVFLLDIIEHLDKADGLHLLQECERVARKQIVVFTPFGFMEQDYESGEQDAWGLKGGSWQKHRSGWLPEDFGPEWDILACKDFHEENVKGDTFAAPVGAMWAIKTTAAASKAPSAKFAVLSASFPPSLTGQAIVLGRLLKDLDPDAYCLLSKEHYDRAKNDKGIFHWLPAQYYWVGWDAVSPESNNPVWRKIKRGFFALQSIIQRIGAILAVIRAEKIELLVGCTGSILDIVCGFAASKLAGIDFVAYIFDDYVYQWYEGRTRGLLKWFAPYLFSHCAAVIVPNEFLQQAYQQRYQIKPVIIHNPIEALPPPQEFPWPLTPGKIRIVYTGSIYEAHYDAFKNLIEALALLNRPEVELHLYTTQTRQTLEENGIQGEYKNFLPVKPEAAAEFHRQADILFLPLAFQSPYPEVIKTSAPGKMGEYLASGRPVLAHVPEDTFINWYFTHYGVGPIVSQPNPQALAKKIEEIIDHPDWRKEWCQKAREQAEKDFLQTTAQQIFLETLQRIRPSSSISPKP